jgi:hypothetical protein
MAKEGKKSRSPIMLLVTILLMEAGLVFLLMPKDPLVQMREHEFASIQTYLGEKTQVKVKKMADDWFVASFVKTGFMQATYDFLLNQWEQENDRFDDRGLSKLVDRRLDVFWLSIHQAYYRFAVMAAWLPYLLPLLFASLVDGLLQREIRKWQFSFSSPAAHRAATKAIYLVIGMALLSPFFPLALPPLAMPLMMGAVALSLWVSAANIQKRI